MKNITLKPTPGTCRLLIALIIVALTIFQLQPAYAVSSAEGAATPALPIATVPAAAAMKLIAFCADPKVGLDDQAVATLVDYVLESKSGKEAELPKVKEAPGAYYEYDMRISFTNFLHYSYNNEIPSTLTSPASLRYSLWNALPGELQKMPGTWKSIPRDGKPVIIFGVERDGITPDANTGVYYEYDLKRTLILLNYKGKQVLLSVSKQIEISDIGKKGVILGNDDDWNYYYSGIPGSTKAGLGWVKSYIYDFFSVGVYVETGSSPAKVRSGYLQWIRAGWSGINFVKTEHIIKGMKRNAKNTKEILESPKLPAPNQIISTYHKLCALPKNDLVERYSVLQQARQAQAVLSGKIDSKEIKKDTSYADTSREQIVEELMLEYFKITLGKSSLLGKKVVMGQ